MRSGDMWYAKVSNTPRQKEMAYCEKAVTYYIIAFNYRVLRFSCNETL